MHGSNLRAVSEIDYSPQLIPEDYFAPLDIAEIFARAAPLEVDLGCGDGTFLVALAERFPQRNFLGIERLLGRVRSACGKAVRSGLRNVRILRVETSYAVEYLLPPQCAEVVFLLFPDPWPKKRHHRRRVVTKSFLAAVHRVLAPNGRFRIATDQEDYFQSIRQMISPAFFVEEDVERAETFVPLTTFEKHFLASGAPIYRLELGKVS
jgi:tRNA (guanine-N7-)-methyltransferase